MLKEHDFLWLRVHCLCSENVWVLMLGDFFFSQGTNERPSLMPLAMSRIITMAENTQSSVEISFYEVYMDRVYDLLEPKNKEVPVLEDSEGRMQLRGLAQVSF